ncbi:Pr6Pr family membrane protein [Granulicella sp. L60]|jgi:hypothetical protein|uniref:Pr6Pr family membrane protein n=1 Tax=Granulicella sp. L60 TaxID=1641866 RepID=UPI00131A707E|nr:Pr6Pr family membrane protein [Granulicella sp. L60]
MAGAQARSKPYFFVMAVIAWLALILQIALVLKTLETTGQFVLSSLINTFSYFTILTNLLVAIVSTAAALRGPNDPKDSSDDVFLTRPSTLSATAAYILIVGVTYSLLLRSFWDPTGLQAVANSALHDVTPVLYLLCWFFFVPKGTLHWSQPFRWLLYPVLYVIYCLLRGMATGIYPYHFVDATILGYPRALINTAAVLFSFWLVGLLLVALDRAAARAIARRTPNLTHT